MKLKVICALVAAMVIAAPLSASAQVTKTERKGVPRDSVPTPTGRPASKRSTTTDHRQTLESALDQVGPFKQWMIGANRRR